MLKSTINLITPAITKENSKMTVTLFEIGNIFDQLIGGHLSREDVANWAQQRQQAEDDGVLEYEPPSQEKELWDAILYLEGVDLKDEPQSYLHTVKDFQEYRYQWEKQLPTNSSQVKWTADLSLPTNPSSRLPHSGPVRSAGSPVSRDPPPPRHAPVN